MDNSSSKKQKIKIHQSDIQLYMIIYNNSLFEKNSQYYKLKKLEDLSIMIGQQQSGNLKII